MNRQKFCTECFPIKKNSKSTVYARKKTLQLLEAMRLKYDSAMKSGKIDDFENQDVVHGLCYAMNTISKSVFKNDRRRREAKTSAYKRLKNLWEKQSGKRTEHHWFPTWHNLRTFSVNEHHVKRKVLLPRLQLLEKAIVDIKHEIEIGGVL